jgi:hypothetical protein
MEGAPPGLYRLERELTREQLIDELAALPVRVRDAISNADAGALALRASPGAWSAFDVCKHLRDITQVYGMQVDDPTGRCVLPQLRRKRLGRP